MDLFDGQRKYKTAGMFHYAKFTLQTSADVAKFSVIRTNSIHSSDILAIKWATTEISELSFLKNVRQGFSLQLINLLS